MDSSFKDMKTVQDDLLNERIEAFKDLSETDNETYDIVRDRVTGEYYLNYSYLQGDFIGGGEAWYHQLMPLEYDDVIAIALGEQAYTYPDHWHRQFLRNGPDGKYVWFSPEYADDYEENHQLGQEIIQKLQQFKKEGHHDPDAVKQLLEQLDDLRHNKP